jgi:hypothetical protein
MDFTSTPEMAVVCQQQWFHQINEVWYHHFLSQLN